MTTMDRLAWAGVATPRPPLTADIKKGWRPLSLLIKWSAQEAVGSAQGHNGHLRVKSQTPKQCQPNTATSKWKEGGGGEEYANYARIEAHSYVKQGLALSLFTPRGRSNGTESSVLPPGFIILSLLHWRGQISTTSPRDPPVSRHVWSFTLGRSRPGNLIWAQGRDGTVSGFNDIPQSEAQS